MFWRRKKPEPQQPKAPEINSETLSFVVMRELKKTIRGYNNINVGGSNEDALAKEQAEINRIRQWAKTLEVRQVRHQYFSWLDFFQRGLDEAKQELKEQKNKKEMEAYRKQNDELFARIHELEASGVVPTPPKSQEAM